MTIPPPTLERAVDDERKGTEIIEVCGKAYYWDKLVEKYGIDGIISLLETTTTSIVGEGAMEEAFLHHCREVDRNTDETDPFDRCLWEFAYEAGFSARAAQAKPDVEVITVEMLERAIIKTIRLEYMGIDFEDEEDEQQEYAMAPIYAKAVAKMVQPYLTISKPPASDAVDIVRGLAKALKGAKNAINGREHTGFIDKALTAADRWLATNGATHEER